MLEVTIPYDPIVKKNNRPIYRDSKGRPFLGKNQKLAQAEADLITFFSRWIAVMRLKGYTFPLQGNLFEYAKFNKKRKGKVDVTNLIELINDCLKIAGVIEDDSQFVHVVLDKKIGAEENSTYLRLGPIVVGETISNVSPMGTIYVEGGLPPERISVYEHQ